MLKQRLFPGTQEKAKRSELIRVLAPGYVQDLSGQIVKDADLRVQEVMSIVDEMLKVYSEEGLWVADASIMPESTSCNYLIHL